MDAIDDDEFFDDWIIKSMKSYKHLHMFDLPQPTCVIEWNEKNGIFVAGCSPDCRNEILEMSIPAKLTWESSSKTAAGLTKDRDFKMLRGGFSDKPIHCLKYLRGTRPRLIVTGSHASPHLDVWQLDTETNDVIKKLPTVPGRATEGGGVRGGVRGVAQRPGHKGHVAFGSTMSNLQVADVGTKEVIATDFGKADCVVEMKFLNENELVTCNTQRGLINIHDLRIPSSQSPPSNHLMSNSRTGTEQSILDGDSSPKDIDQSHVGLDTSIPESSNENTSCKGGATWTFDLRCTSDTNLDPSNEGDIACKKPKLDATVATVVSLCSSGELLIRDLRNLESPLHHVKLGDERRLRKSGNLTVKWCPTEKTLLSVSGLNGCVDIYDTSTWQQRSNSPPMVKPVFSHEGHITGESANQDVGILCHAWHPWQPCVVMSSGSDGSLHAWDWSSVS
ncbi:WD repeat-containing protein 73-like [Patiria miniata]|uniref:WD repeat-containing protein 73 n=1 Tax=Patiria miniata TaxID=46514 RepID=A0A913ZG38_PATMI|nr:WD repeat-containing protein 73-like [Patiria miniata]